MRLRKRSIVISYVKVVWILTQPRQEAQEHFFLTTAKSQGMLTYAVFSRQIEQAGKGIGLHQGYMMFSILHIVIRDDSEFKKNCHHIFFHIVNPNHRSHNLESKPMTIKTVAPANAEFYRNIV